MFDKIPAVQKCCFCVNLRIGAIIVGFLEVIMFLTDFIMMYIRVKPLYPRIHNDRNISIIIWFLNAIVNSGGAILGIFLIFGAIMVSIGQD